MELSKLQERINPKESQGLQLFSSEEEELDIPSGKMEEYYFQDRLENDEKWKNREIFSEIDELGYKVIEKIGEGGFGLVYKIKNIKENKIYAGKFIYTSLIEDIEPSDIQKKARNEYFIGKEIRKACGDVYVDVIDLYEHVVDKKFNFFSLIVMEYVEGQNLIEWLNSELSKRRNRDYFIAIGYLLVITLANALQCLHNYGYLHNDIKLENIIIGNKEGKIVIKLIDLGLLCKSVGNVYKTYPCKYAGAMCDIKKPRGTDYTVAPEVVRCGNNFVKSESWSVGASIFRIVSEGRYAGYITKQGEFVPSKNYNSDMAYLKEKYYPMYAILTELLKVNPRTRASLPLLREYILDNKNIRNFLYKNLKIKLEKTPYKYYRY